MNARDLRIGNIVFDKSRSEHDFEKLENGIYRVSAHAIERFDAGFMDLKPVHLTSEWLERFGFKQFVHDSELQGKIVEYNYDNNLLTIVDWSSEGKKFTLSNSFSFKLRVDVNYVHHLQNLIFALTGSELQLKDKTV